MATRQTSNSEEFDGDAPGEADPARAPLAHATRRMVASDLDSVMEVERLAFQHPWSSDLFARELMHDWSVILLATPPEATELGSAERMAPEPMPAEPLAAEPLGADRGRPFRLGHPPVYAFVIYWLVHDEVHILNVATHPHFRGRGIARTLMDAAIAHGRARGAKIVTLEVRRSNFAAINLYRDLGFRPVGVRPNYYPEEQEDALVMTLTF